MTKPLLIIHFHYSFSLQGGIQGILPSLHTFSETRKNLLQAPALQGSDSAARRVLLPVVRLLEGGTKNHGRRHLHPLSRNDYFYQLPELPRSDSLH